MKDDDLFMIPSTVKSIPCPGGYRLKRDSTFIFIAPPFTFLFQIYSSFILNGGEFIIMKLI